MLHFIMVYCISHNSSTVKQTIIFHLFSFILGSHKYADSTLSSNIQNQEHLRAKGACHKRFSRGRFCIFPISSMFPP